MPVAIWHQLRWSRLRSRWIGCFHGLRTGTREKRPRTSGTFVSSSLGAFNCPEVPATAFCACWARRRLTGPDNTNNGAISTAESGSQKYVRIDPRLLQDCSERPFRHIAGMIRKRGIAIGARVVPDLMTARRLTVELETASPQFAGEIPVAESRKSAHLRCHYNRVVALRRGRRQRKLGLTFAPRFDQLAGDVPSYLQRFRNRSSLCHQPRQLLGRREIDAFRQLLNMDANSEFHLPHRSTGNPER